MADKYTNYTDDDCDLANEWWKEFCQLPEEKLAIVKGIIGKKQIWRRCIYRR